MKKKFSVLIFGIFFTTLILELGLRLFANQNLPTNPEREMLSSWEVFTILTVGNSFTAGSGAPPGESYPDQLRRMIKAKFPDFHFRVINEGTPGQNSAQLLRKLPNNLQSYQPDLVIVQTGQPNWWNPYHYSDYLEREKKLELHTTMSFFNTLYDLAFNFKFFRFFVYTYHQMLVEKRLKEVQESDRSCCHLQLADSKGQACLQQHRSINECIKIYQRAIRLNPGNSANYHQLGQLYFDTLNEHWVGMNYFIKGIKAIHQVDPNFYCNNYLALKERMPKIKSRFTRWGVQLALLALRIRSPEKAAVLMLDRQDSIDWAVSDLNEIIKQLQEHRGNHGNRENQENQGKKIQVIMQNYPPLPAFFLVDDINEVLRGVAKKAKIPFVDNEKLYQKLWDSGLRREEYHANNGSDPHPNAKGYGLMAQHVFDAIIKHKMLPQQLAITQSL